MPPVEVRDPGVQYKRVLGGFVLTTQDLLMKKAVVWYEGETTPGMKKRKKKFGAQGFTCDSKSSQVFNIFPRQESSTSTNDCPVPCLSREELILWRYSSY